MRRAVFLDRDGTLIRNHHYGCDPDGIELLEGVPEGLGLLKRAGYALVVVTNQSGIARGFFTERDLEVMHRRLGQLLEQRGAGIDGWYYCPHHPEGVVPEYSITCDCRKPRSGMVRRACSDLGLDPAASWMVGDILDDVEAGKGVGTRAVLLDVGTEGKPDRPERTPEYVAQSFMEAVRYILLHSAQEDSTAEGAEGAEPSQDISAASAFSAVQAVSRSTGQSVPSSCLPSFRRRGHG